MKYFIGIDALKGLLLVFVFLGHLLPGSLSENFVRYAIYSFHMPLFMGISGALLTSESLARYRLPQLVVRYFNRMLLPWLVACVVYFPVTNISFLRQGLIPWQEMPGYVLYPWYHLWFVPVLFLMVVVVRLLERYEGGRRGVVLLGALLLSVLGLLFFRDVSPEQNLLVYLLGDKRLYTYFFFFYLGYVLRNMTPAKGVPLWFCLGCVIGLAGVRCVDFWVDLPEWMGVLVFVGLNAGLIVLCVRFLAEARFWGGRVLVLMGVNSLPIYLWHVLPLLMLQVLSIHERYPAVYYGLAVLSFVGLIWLVKILPRVPITNRFIFGLSSANKSARLGRSAEQAALPR